MITLALARQLGAKIGKGMPEEFACHLLGIKYPAWLKAKERHPEFVEAVKGQQAIFMDTALDGIQAGLPGWQGLAWILERRHKPHFDRTREAVELHATNAIAFTPDQMADLSRLAHEMQMEGRALKTQTQDRP